MKNSIILNAKKSWEQLVGENSRQFLAFSQYLELGSQRSFSKIASACHIPRRTVSDWADKWSWDKRASDFDRYIIEDRKSKKRERYEKIDDLRSDCQFNAAANIYNIIDLINNKSGAEIEKLSLMELNDILSSVKLLTKVMPALFNLASDSLDIAKPDARFDEPLDLMSVYDDRPELIDDVTDLLGKIFNKDDQDHPLE